MSKPAVRKLKWNKAGKVYWATESVCGEYGIERHTDTLGHTFFAWFRPGGWGIAEIVSGYNSTLDQAKESVQRHHDLRILCSLEE